MTAVNQLASSEFRRGWPLILSAMVGIAFGLSPMPFYTIGIFAPLLAREFHWSFAQIFAGITCTTVAVVIASPLVGLLSDHYGVRRVALSSVVLFALGFMSLGAGNGSLTLYYASWLVLALFGAGTLPITWTRAVNNGFESGKGLALGLSLLGTGLFGYCIKPVAAWLIAHYGWRGAYLAIGAMPLLFALPIGLLCFHDPGQRDVHARHRREAARARSASTPGLSMRQTVHQWRFWLLGLCFVSLAFGVGGLIANMENLLKLAGFERSSIVALTSMIGLSVIAGRIAGGWLIDRFWAPAVAAALLGAPALACILLGDTILDYRTAALSIILIGLAAGAEYDLLAYLVARYFGMKSYGSIYGSLYSFFAFGAGLGPVFFGADFDRTHAYSQSLSLAAILFVLPALLLLLMGRYRQFDQSGVQIRPGDLRSVGVDRG
jgi:predicted MFS family arabinose efflux permease